jgi:hypothetical protein
MVGVLILSSITTLNPNIPQQLRIAEAFAVTWEMILPFAISGVLALAGRTKIAKILTAAGFVLVVILLFGMARALPKMNQPFIVLLIPEALVAHS